MPLAMKAAHRVPQFAASVSDGSVAAASVHRSKKTQYVDSRMRVATRYSSDYGLLSRLQKETDLTYVVTEACIKCKYTDCVDVCPVDCFHEGPNFLVIDPDECIDCTLCVAECPAEAIFAEDDVPAQQQHFVALNAELAKMWPVIIERKEPSADADEWLTKPDKFSLLER